MDDELHAARLVEESLEDDRLLRGQSTQRRARRGEIVDELLRGRRCDAAIVRRDSATAARRVSRLVGPGDRRSVAQSRHRVRQLVAARRRLAQPERNGRRLALGILDAHAPGFDAPDPPRRVAELEDVAGEALDGEVLVDRADELSAGSSMTS